MARPVTADHVLFNECIFSFRPNREHFESHDNEASHSYLLTSFQIPTLWQLPNCIVNQSGTVHLSSDTVAFICKVDNPEWVRTHNSHLYGIALSAIISFVSGRPCKSTRDDYLCRNSTLTGDDAFQLGIQHPVLICGPGSAHTQPSAKTINKYNEETEALILKLLEIPYEKYVIGMQAIRLVHLSLLNKRDDFGLAYLLVVSAIEAVTQHAIKRKSIKHPNEAAWTERASQDQDFAELLKSYKEARGQNAFLKERYARFIHTYAPAKDWEKITRHPMQDVADLVTNLQPDQDISHLTKKRWDESYPSDLTADQINGLIFDSYTHRSCFIHRGEQPPHRSPYAYNRFFQTHIEYKGTDIIESVLPNYELLTGIAKQSISNWLKSL